VDRRRAMMGDWRFALREERNKGYSNMGESYYTIFTLINSREAFSPVPFEP